MMRTTRMPPRACPRCGQPLSAAANLEGHAPEADCPTICVHCLGILVFQAAPEGGLTMRAMTRQEWDELDAEFREELRAAQRHARDVVRRAELLLKYQPRGGAH